MESKKGLYAVYNKWDGHLVDILVDNSINRYFYA